MKKLSNEEIKTIELDLLRYVHHVCEENHLRYFLCGGSLIGAVRHQGFIPWDDDIDINMPRKDYELLKEKVKDNKKYRFISMDDEDYYYCSGKLVDCSTELRELNMENEITGLGVNIDIFPLDGLPKNKKKADKQFNDIRRYKQAMFWMGKGGPKFRKHPLKMIREQVQWAFYKKHDLRYYKKKISELVCQYDFDESDYVFSSGGRYGKKEMYPRKFFDHGILMPFEGEMLYAPCGYDDFLTQMYGDYMKLPPKEKQVSNHDFVAYWKEDSIT